MPTIENNKLTPELKAQWHPTLNGELKAEDVTMGSNRKVWWMCNKGHEYPQMITSKVSGTGKCLVCTGNYIQTGINDLETLYPEIAAQWHPTLNNELTPSMVSPGRKQKVWWKCDKGHDWETTIERKAKLNVQCHYCLNRKVLIGYNDLHTTNPEITSQLHPTLNKNITAFDLMAGSSKKVWWLDEYGHVWETSPKARITDKQNCPICANQKILIGFNDLATTHPEIAKQWHPTKNGLLTATEVIAGSKQKIWWLDKKGHEHYSAIYEYIKSGNGCLDCGLKVGSTKKSTPKNGSDLQTIAPEIAAQWHPTKNGELTPSMVNAGSVKRAYWICVKEHEWDTKIVSRVDNETGCPTCAHNVYISKAEQQIFEYLTNLGLTVEQSNRKILDGKEIDLWIPEKNVGIEFNGLYWHNETSGKTNSYHKEKYAIAKNKGVQLIQIWEDDWTHRKTIVKNSLAHKLGVTQAPKIFARKTKIITLNTKETQNFLNETHIQGFASGTHYIGLQTKEGSLEAVMVLKKEPNNTLNIIRYATKSTIIGGFTKLLSYATKTYKPNKFITFADHTISDGGLYENNGFIVDKILPPDYMYIIKDQRKHKFGYRIKRFKNDPNLQYIEGYTETQLAQLNNIHRIWDAGKTRYVLHITKP